MAATMSERPGRSGHRPWYGEAWVWFLIALPAAAVLGSAVTIVLAVRSADGVVAADYYKRGLAINEQLARTRAAARLGLRAELRIDGIGGGDAVRLRLNGSTERGPEAAIRLRLVHPGRSGADRLAVLARIPSAFGEAGETFVGQWGEAAPVAEPVAWRVVLEGNDWRLDGDAGIGAWPREIRVSAQRQ